MVLSLLVAGSNAHGQLGTGDCEDVHNFIRCLFHWDGIDRDEMPPGSARVERIVGGANHTLLLTSTTDRSSELWFNGDNSKGQVCASASKKDTTVFRRISIEYQSVLGWRLKNIAAAWETSYFVLSDGSKDAILAMGSNERYMLGHDGLDGVHLIDLSGPLDGADYIVRDIVAGPMHVVALLHLPSRSQSVAVGWGTTKHSQLGEPIEKVWNRPRIIALPESTSIASVALGNQHTVFRHIDGTVTALGSSRVGQLAGVSYQHDVGSVQCTWNGTYILSAGNVLSTGKNDNGQLGRSTSPSSPPSLAQVTFPSTFADKRIHHIACGSEHVVVLTDDGEVWGWGWNEHGNLGTGDRENVLLPVRLWCADRGQSARGIWAGCGTTFVAVERSGP